ncbi:MAG: glycosyltransferase family 2 protein [bacterium]
MLRLSIIIISWKMKQMLRDLLVSIRQCTTGMAYEIIIVDNNSQDGTSEMVEQEFSDARLIRNQENRGVAPARNQAFRIALGTYVVTLDADMQLKENSLLQLVEYLDRHPSVGLCGCKLTFPDGSVQPSARRFPTPLSFLMRRLEFLEWARQSASLRYHEMADWDRSDTRSVDYVIGACQMIRRTAMDHIGLLDEKIFYGPEDIDYCLRMHRAGWDVVYLADTAIIHHEQRITKKNFFSALMWRHLKGIFYLFTKYHGTLSYKR